MPLNVTKAVSQPDPGFIGVVAAVNGLVNIESPSKVGKIAESGESVFLGDVISTGPEGKLQVLLLDETVFTIGPDSRIVIDEFIYDPSTHDGKIDARVLKGIFRLVTGKIAKKTPENVEVKLPTGSVGIRGTILYGEIKEESSFLMLMGPGEKNNTQHRRGAIEVKNQVNGKSVSEQVQKSGFGSEIAGKNIAPTPAFRVPESKVAALTGALTAEGEERTAPQKKDGAVAPSASDRQQDKTETSKRQRSNDGPGEDSEGDLFKSQTATREAGQDDAGSLGELSDLKSIRELGEDLSHETTEASQDSADESGNISDGLSTIDQLKTIETGVFHYEQDNVVLRQKSDGSPKGTYNFKFDIDFGSRKVGGGNSAVEITATGFNNGGAATMPLGERSFGSGVGNQAFFQYTFGTSDVTGCSVCTGDVSVILLNAEGEIAADAAHVVQASDSLDLTGLGFAERSEGKS